MTTERSLTVTPGNYSDACPLCGIHRQNAGFLRETCGDGYLKPGCFIVATESTTSQEQPYPDGPLASRKAPGVDPPTDGYALTDPKRHEFESKNW